ncbi:hypothetical protein EDD85DRAFT_784523 [Armillaria nabsnona]|nr:hypothetical protein EDD85DRAFT_784523 [Armillaria nabsnona]
METMLESGTASSGSSQDVLAAVFRCDENELKAYEYIYRHQLYDITLTYYALHATGIVHHDLVLRNITRDENGVFRIIDFESHPTVTPALRPVWNPTVRRANLILLQKGGRGNVFVQLSPPWMKKLNVGHPAAFREGAVEGSETTIHAPSNAGGDRIIDYAHLLYERLQGNKCTVQESTIQAALTQEFLGFWWYVGGIWSGIHKSGMRESAKLEILARIRTGPWWKSKEKIDERE